MYFSCRCRCDGGFARSLGILLIAAILFYHQAPCLASGAAVACGGRSSVPTSLFGCYDVRPVWGSQSCYRLRVDSNGDAEAVCDNEASDAGGNVGVVARCRNDAWVFLPNAPRCKARARSVWRIVALQTTIAGWWLRDLEFFRDSSCSRSLAGETQQEFDNGPAGSQGDRTPPSFAFDGTMATVWHAPCLESSHIDVCGCRRDLGQGWKAADSSCVVGEITSGRDEKDCVDRATAVRNGNLYTAPAPTLGCPAGQASVGIHLKAPQEVECLQLQQVDSSTVRTSAVALEVWNGARWEEVRRWDNLRGGEVETLHVTQGCAAYSLPSEAPRWTTVVGPVGDAAHGGSMTVQCVGGEPSAQVQCVNGKWSAVPALICLPPALTQPPPSGHVWGIGGANSHAENSSLSPVASSLLAVFGICAGAGLLALVAFFLRRLLRHFVRKHREAQYRLELQHLPFKQDSVLGAAPPLPPPDFTPANHAVHHTSLRGAPQVSRHSVVRQSDLHKAPVQAGRTSHPVPVQVRQTSYRNR